MSLGFHYLATMEQSLAMQWTSARDLPMVLGRVTAIASLASLVTYGLVFAALTLLELSYLPNFPCRWRSHPRYRGTVPVRLPALRDFGAQTKAVVLRRRYWLYYALEFLSGARRQIFLVFAAS